MAKVRLPAVEKEYRRRPNVDDAIYEVLLLEGKQRAEALYGTLEKRKPRIPRMTAIRHLQVLVRLGMVLETEAPNRGREYSLDLPDTPVDLMNLRGTFVNIMERTSKGFPNEQEMTEFLSRNLRAILLVIGSIFVKSSKSSVHEKSAMYVDVILRPWVAHLATFVHFRRKDGSFNALQNAVLNLASNLESPAPGQVFSSKGKSRDPMVR